MTPIERLAVCFARLDDASLRRLRDRLNRGVRVLCGKNAIDWTDGKGGG
jgi:hypothetical protein